MSADEFYLDGGADYADEPATIEDLSTAELDETAQEIYGLPDWRAVEEQWAAEDAQQVAEVEQRELGLLAEQYGNQRLGQLTSQIAEQAGGGDFDLKALHGVAEGLLRDPGWLRDHVGLEGEPAVAAALRDALTALTPASDENEALRRRGLRMAAGGLTQKGEPDDGPR